MEGYVNLAMSYLLQVVPLVAAAVSYIFFITASLAIARSRTGRLEELVEEGATGAARALEILAKSEGYLLCAQVGRFLSSVGAGMCLAGVLTRSGIGGTFESVWSSTAAMSAIVFIVFVSVTLVLVQVAKACTLQFPEFFLRAVSLPLKAAFTVFGPALLFIHGVVSRVLRIFNVRTAHEREMAVGADDISEFVRMSSESGALEKEEQELLEGVVELSDSIVREVMTPRKDVVFVRESATIEDVLATLSKASISRALVCGADLDDVRGILIAKDLLRYVGKTMPSDAWKTFIRPAFFVPNTKHIDELLGELRQKGIHMAVVLDEHGGVDGIVTMEDLMEEIVGEIFDEFDRPSEESPTKELPDGALVVDGGVLVDDLSAQFNIDLPQGEYDTVAGFVMSHLGRVPTRGEGFVLEPFTFRVDEVNQNRVLKVRIQRLDSVEASVAATASSAVGTGVSGARSVLVANGAPEPAPETSVPPRTLRISQAS